VGKAVAGKATRPKGASGGAAGAGPAGYARLSSDEVLRAIVAFSREVTAEMDEATLFALFFRTLRDLLPGRQVAIRIVDGRSLRVTKVLADERTVADADELPPFVERGALAFANVRRNLPVDLRAPDGSGRSVAVVDEPPRLFPDAVGGFSVPLVAGGQMTAEVHVNYPRAGWQDDAAARADKALVIPLANHVAVVAHTRRLLHDTAYLQGSLEQLIDQANVLILATDAAGRVTVWNRAMNRLTGYARGQVLGQELGPWLAEKGAADIAQVMKQVLASGEPANREVRLPTSGGAALRAAFNVVTVRGHDGRVEAALAVGQDVTALRQLQSQVIHAEKLSTVGQIAAGVAHEINNPLTSIQVCAEALLRKATLAAEGRASAAFDAPDVDRLKKIGEGADRIRRFARDLVSYARPTGSEAEHVLLNDVVEQGLSFCEHVIEAARARIERDLAPALPRLQAVRDQLLQVVINLVTNAAHAVESRGGLIRVRTWSAGGASVGFAISDDGVGIKDEDRAKIFDPFFTTKPAGRGTGLGLSVVRNIVYAHGGQISFQTRAGGGTTFIVTLPLTHLGSSVPTGDRPPS
jgi:PAS domain S-box-containing protein